MDVDCKMSFMVATNLPSCVAPRRILCRVIGRCPTVVNIRVLGTDTFTGRPVCLAPTAASQEWGQGKSLEPKPDPMKGEITSIDSCGIPKTWDATLR